MSQEAQVKVCALASCQTAFTPKTIRAEFCSDKCRVQANRLKKSQAVPPLPEKDRPAKNTYPAPPLPKPSLATSTIVEITGDLPEPSEEHQKVMLYWAKRLFEACRNSKPMFVNIMTREVEKLTPKAQEAYDFNANRARMMQEAPQGTNAWQIRQDK